MIVTVIVTVGDIIAYTGYIMGVVGCFIARPRYVEEGIPPARSRMDLEILHNESVGGVLRLDKTNIIDVNAEHLCYKKHTIFN